MKNCPKCQRTLVDDAKFCMYCGATLETTPPEPAVAYCRNCGMELSGSFCVNCGTPANGTTPAAAPVAAPKKKGKGGLIAAIIAVVLVLALAASWAFGLFGDGGLFGEDGLLSSESDRDRDRDDDDDEDEDEDDGEFGHASRDEATTAPEATAVPSEPEREQVYLTVWAPAEDSEWLYTMADKFSQVHPEYEITYEFVYVSEADAKNYMLSDVEAGADVYMYANDQLGELVEANALAPITGNVLKQVQYGASSTMLSSVTYGDAVYGIPVSGNTWWLYYDKSVYSESDIRSLETMLEKGKVAFRLNNSWYFGAFYFANGCTMFGANGNNASAGFDFGGDKAVAVTNYLVDLVQNPNFVCDDGQNGLAGIQDGTIKAFVSGDWEAQLVKEALGENFGAAQLPCITIDGQQKQLRAFAGSKAIGINPNSDNMIASYLFAMYLGSAEGQLLRYEMRGVIPCDTSLADAISNDPVALAQMNCLNNSATVQPTIPEMGVWWSYATNLANEIIAGSVTHKNAEAKTEDFNEILNNG